MGVIVVLRALSGLAVSESNIEIMCLSKQGIPAAITIYSGDGEVQVYNQTNELEYLGGGRPTTMPICPSRSTGAYVTHSAASGSTPSNCTTDRALPSISKPEC